MSCYERTSSDMRLGMFCKNGRLDGPDLGAFTTLKTLPTPENHWDQGSITSKNRGAAARHQFLATKRSVDIPQSISEYAYVRFSRMTYEFDFAIFLTAVFIGKPCEQTNQLSFLDAAVPTPSEHTPSFAAGSSARKLGPARGSGRGFKRPLSGSRRLRLNACAYPPL